jgi:hypothetical protein
MRGKIVAARCNATLNKIARLIGRPRPVLPPARYDRLVTVGLAKPSAITA